MKTSGASSETSMVVTIVVIAVALLVTFAGGPSEFMGIVNHSLKVALEFCMHLYKGAHA
jgi:hypothetical protein